jgi:signal transduction histidine kinase
MNKHVTIVAGIDFSDSSSIVLRHAIHAAESRDTTVIAVHVLEKSRQEYREASGQEKTSFEGQHYRISEIARAAELPEGEREEYLDMLGDANEGVGRVIRIVTDLRSFTKGHSMDFAPVSLVKVIESTRRLVSQEIRDIAFEVDVPETLEVSGNDNQLVQVFVNLLQNASQAIHKGSGHSNPPKIRISAEVEAEGAIVVCVHDNGCGIPADDLEHIFDPFFTKRDIGEGMGLGLSICHRIIESHHATITARSEDGQFTEFVLSFPSPGSSASQIIPGPSQAISEI